MAKRTPRKKKAPENPGEALEEAVKAPEVETAPETPAEDLKASVSPEMLEELKKSLLDDLKAEMGPKQELPFPAKVQPNSTDRPVPESGVGLVTLRGPDPSQVVKPQPMLSDGHGGVHRGVDMMGKGVPKHTGVQQPAPGPVDYQPAPEPVEYVNHPEPVTTPQGKKLKVTLYVDAGARKVGPAGPVHWARILESSFWNTLLNRRGQPMYGDPEIMCSGVEVAEETKAELLGDYR